jgi:hypothetical protein
MRTLKARTHEEWHHPRMTERGRCDLGERRTQSARGLDRIVRCCREPAVRSRQMAELMYDSSLLPRNEQE